MYRYLKKVNVRRRRRIITYDFAGGCDFKLINMHGGTTEPIVHTGVHLAS